VCHDAEDAEHGEASVEGGVGIVGDGVVELPGAARPESALNMPALQKHTRPVRNTCTSGEL